MSGILRALLSTEFVASMRAPPSPSHPVPPSHAIIRSIAASYSSGDTSVLASVAASLYFRAARCHAARTPPPVCINR
jgi:hypothetical protein